MAYCEISFGDVPREMLDPNRPGDVYVALVSLAMRMDCLRPQFPRLQVYHRSEELQITEGGPDGDLYGRAGIVRVDPKDMFVRASRTLVEDTSQPLGVKLDLLINSGRVEQLQLIEQKVIKALTQALAMVKA